MTTWELRRAMEDAMPWWVGPAVVVAGYAIVYGIAGLLTWREKRRKR